MAPSARAHERTVCKSATIATKPPSTKPKSAQGHYTVHTLGESVRVEGQAHLLKCVVSRQ
eukprot:scaffold40207_cov50-Tisochrysis_lutea.AAC.1